MPVIGLIELIVPQLRSVPPGEIGRVFTLDADHVGVETFDDTVEQIAWSHHWMEVQGRLVRHSAPYRYVWPTDGLDGHVIGNHVTGNALSGLNVAGVLEACTISDNTGA